MNAIKLHNWSFICWGVWLACIIYSQYTYGIKAQAVPADSPSLTQLWKVCSTLYTVSLVNEIIVSALYWGLLYPSLSHSLR